MTQFTPYPPGDPVGQPPAAPYPPQPRRLSALAVLSLVLGLLFCIPLVAPALGLLFGIIALAMIGKSKRQLRGQGLAIAGIVISVLVLCVHVVGGVVLYRFANVPAALAESFMRDVVDNDFASARSSLSSQTAQLVTDEHLATLQRRFIDDYGPLESVSVDYSGRAFTRGVAPPIGGWSQMQAWQTNWNKCGGPNVPPAGPIPIKCEFTKGTVYGVMMMAVEPDSPTVPPLFVHSLTLIDDEGPWDFPFEKVGNEASPSLD